MEDEITTGVEQDYTEKNQDQGEGDTEKPKSNDELLKIRQIADDQRKRAEKLEAELKELKAKSNETPTSGLSREEAMLIAKGYSDDELSYVSKVATLEGVSLLEAVNTDLFQTWKVGKDQKKKEQEAKLRASRSAGSKAGEEKTMTSPGLSSQEFRKMYSDALRKGKR